jgi:hypothetical protein
MAKNRRTTANRQSTAAVRWHLGKAASLDAALLLEKVPKRAAVVLSRRKRSA